MSFQLSRDCFIPKDPTLVVRSKRSSAIVYLHQLGPKLAAKGFVGKGAKPAFFYTFRDEDRRTVFVSKWLADQELRESHRLANIAVKSTKIAAFVMPYKAGDILYSSWGYDQTNIDFYQVVEIVGKRTIITRKVAQVCESAGRGSDSVSASHDNFIGKPERHVVSLYGSVKISECQSAYLWDGKSKHQTASGWGH
jgi:hypothetical protein